MPDPDRLLATIRQAVRACRTTPGRCGRLLRLEGAEEVLVSGDLHGNLENFRRLLRLADLGGHPRRHFVLQELIHGTFEYSTGGDKSHQLLDVAAALKSQYPERVHILPGNHELAQWTGRRIEKNERDLNDSFDRGVEAAYGRRAAEVQAAYAELFAALPLALRTANRVFLSHSLPSARRLVEFDPGVLEQEESRPEELLPGGSVFALLWGRDTSPANVEAFLRKVDADLLVSGHIPCERGYDTPNDRQLILDSLGSPAACCLFPAVGPLSFKELVGCVKLL
jgi:calcineurin-like phosphoesterase family protein